MPLCSASRCGADGPRPATCGTSPVVCTPGSTSTALALHSTRQPAVSSAARVSGGPIGWMPPEVLQRGSNANGGDDAQPTVPLNQSGQAAGVVVMTVAG